MSDVLVKCAWCDGKGTQPGDPEGAPIEDCQRCAGSGKRPMKMDAYYYGFCFTGVREIDVILSAVACAGKAYHHTESWNDECSPYHELHRGSTPADWIQNAASDAAVALTALLTETRTKALSENEAEIARLREALNVAEVLYGGLMADDARAMIRAALKAEGGEI